MSKYDHLQTEFEQGFVKGQWKSVCQFSISKGIDPNGHIKRVSKGWRKKAEKMAVELPAEAKEKGKEKYIEEESKEWEEVYKNLRQASSTMSEKIKKLVDDHDFTFLSREGEERIDVAVIKGLMDASLSAINLHKKTYIKEDVPLTTESRQKIGETLAIKEGEQTQEVEDPLKGKTLEQIELEIEKLNE